MKRNSEVDTLRREIAEASPEVLREALDGTVGDAQAYCWGALRQFVRLANPGIMSAPVHHGLQYVDLHTLMSTAAIAVGHVRWAERILRKLAPDADIAFSPPEHLRDRLNVARDLLAEHRTERVLYRRLTGRHSESLEERLGGLQTIAPDGSVDTWAMGFDIGTDPASGQRVTVAGGIVGGFLSLDDLRRSLEDLAGELERIREEYLPG